MSILRSGDMFPKMEGGGWALCREVRAAREGERPEEEDEERDGFLKLWEGARFPGALRPDAGCDFLREEGFERVIGMAK
jgi:hypothetical protein